MPAIDKAARTAPAEMPDHAGHRKRLRERFLKGGGEAWPDYEMLELLLFYAIPRIDVKPIAKALEKKFGSFAGAVAAPPDRVLEVEGMTESAATLLRIVRAAAQRLQQQETLHRQVLGDSSALVAYCRVAMAHEAAEQFRLLFLNAKNVLIADEVQTRGTIDHTPVYIREIAKRALELGAAAIIMAHNHPSGDPTPSRADIDMTIAVQSALGKLGIALHDHLILGRNGHVSLRQLGHLDRSLP